MKKGDLVIDISQHNGYVNFSNLKAKGIEGVIIRLGWIGNKNNHTLDTYFETYYQEAKKYGIPVGMYVYSYVKSYNNMVIACNWIKEKIQGKSFELPLFIDMEDSSTIASGKEDLTNQAIYFNRFFSTQGYTTGTYANLNWFTNYLDISRLVDWKIWCAQYNSSLTLKWKCDLWQYTSSGKLEGVTTSRVDMNKVMCDCNIPEPIPEPTTPEKPKESEVFVDMKIYQNGSTPEPVYSDTALKNKIGSLDPRERCDCLGIFNSRPLVKYKVNGTSNYKCGFVKWLGGVR